MPSFLEDEKQGLVDAVMTEIAEQLLDDWIQSNLEKGQLYSDYRLAEMSGDSYLKERFNEYYNLTPSDQYYFDVH